MEKKSFDIYHPEHWLAALKGFGTGFLGLSGAYAISELLGKLGRTIAPIPKIPEKIYIDIDRKKKKKQGIGLEKDSAFDIGHAISYGLGVPVGGFAAYKAYQYLANAKRKIDYMKKMRELEDIYESQYGEQEKKAMIEGYCEGLSKGAQHYIEKEGTGDIAAIIGKDKPYAPAMLYPMIVAGLLPMSLFAGYYGMKSYMPLPEEEEEVTPKLVFRHGKTAVAELQKLANDSNKVPWYQKLWKGIEATGKGIKAVAYDFPTWLFKTPDPSTISDRSALAKQMLSGVGSAYLLYKLSDVLRHNIGIRKMFGLKPEPWQVKREEEEV